MTRGGRASDGIVLEGGGRRARGGQLFERRDEGADGGDAAGGFEAGGGPAVEGEAGAAGFFGGGYVPVFVHGWCLV